jgi:hypothetical protein
MVQRIPRSPVRARGVAVMPAAALLLTVMTLLPAGLWGQAQPPRVKPRPVAKGIAFEAVLTAGTPVETQVSGDGDAFVEPYETWSLTIPLTNTGNHNATGVVGTLTTSTPGITILTGTSAYPDLTVTFGPRPAAKKGALPIKGEPPPMPTGNNVAPYVFRVGPGVPCGEILQFTLTVDYNGGNPPDNSPQSFPFTIQTGGPGKPPVCDAAPTGAVITATKAVTGGNQQAGGIVIYTVTLNNTGAAAQADNAGDELTDTVPSPLVVGTPTASSGTVSAAGVNPVTWNGAIPAGGSVTLTIPATIPPGTVGQTLSNQGTVNYDSDNDGTNESTGLTDAPGGAANDPTTFVVAGAPIGEIPTLSDFGLALLALMVAGAAVLALRRRRQATGA